MKASIGTRFARGYLAGVALFAATCLGSVAYNKVNNDMEQKRQEQYAEQFNHEVDSIMTAQNMDPNYLYGRVQVMYDLNNNKLDSNNNKLREIYKATRELTSSK